MPLALITGASTGIGRATALRLARSGWTVLAGVRDPDAGESLAREARGGSLLPIALEVTDPDQIARARERVQQEGAGISASPGSLDALVNNAGIAVGGPLEVASPEEMRRQFEVNVFAQLAVTQAMLPALRLAGGRIAFVSSIGGRVAMPYTGLYAGSKHALEAFADALRVELRRSRVQVALIEPGSVTTPIWDKGRSELGRFELPPELEPQYGHVPAAMGRMLQQTESRGVPPELVAETIDGALTARRMRSRYVVGRDARAMLLAKRMLPDRVFDRVVARALGV